MNKLLKESLNEENLIELRAIILGLAIEDNRSKSLDTVEVAKAFEAYILGE